MNFYLIRHIRKKTFFAFLTALLVIIILMTVNFSAMYRVTRANIVNAGKEDAIKSAEQFDDYLLTSIDATELVAYTIENLLSEGKSKTYIRNYLIQETQNYENAISENYTGIYGYFDGAYLDGTGWIPDKDYDPKSRPWYKAAKEAKGETALVTPYVDAETHTMMMTVSKLFSDGESAVAIDLTLNRLQEITDEIYRESENANYVMVIDDKGTVVAMSGKESSSKKTQKMVNELSSAVAKKHAASGQSSFEIKFKGSKYLIYAENIQHNWYAVSIMDESHIFDSLNYLVLISVAVLLLTITAVLLLFASMIKRQVMSDDLNVRLKSAASIYDAVFMIDLDENVYEFVSGDVSDVMGSGDWLPNAREEMIELTNWLSDEQTMADLKAFIDMSDIDDRLAETNTITIEFLDNTNRWCRGRFVAADRHEDNKISKILFMVEVIDKERRQRDKLLYLSETDRLTGINNRGSGEAKITALLKNGEGGMFILLDADHFKSINDNYGHGVGDKVIIAIAKALKESFRDNDVVLRLGGDEFAAYARKVCDKECGEPLVARLISRVSAIEIPEMGGRKIEISIGAAFYLPDDTFEFEELYKRADRCTYLSKKRRGSCASYHYDIM